MRDRHEYPDFLELDITPPPPDKALFHILPAPYEKSVSYGRGTAGGPAAILRASLQLETYDGVSVPADLGIYTHDPTPCDGSPEHALAGIAREVAAVRAGGAIPVVLGGEHTVTLGAVKGLAPEPGFGVVQFDAHADLRDSYENNPLSHACVMHRILEMDIPFFQIGVRSLTRAEDILRSDRGIGHLDALELARHGVPATILPHGFPKRIYVTFDVDALDPSVVSATGTPEPGGLTWYQAMELLEEIVRGRAVIGFDAVELAPAPGLHAADFAVARLIYNFMGIVARSRPDA